MSKRRRSAEEIRLDAYHEFLKFSRQHMADEIIRNGFSGIQPALEIILHTYRQFQTDFPDTPVKH